MRKHNTTERTIHLCGIEKTHRWDNVLMLKTANMKTGVQLFA
jgi:hypothetical protein